ncbi:MAG: hypothetical protein WCA04_10060 [Geobacteraceae bacterium]
MSRIEIEKRGPKGFLEEMDKAMAMVLESEEHLAAHQAWHERKHRRR